MKSAIFFILLTATVALAGAMISIFQARSEGEDIILEWQTTQENNVKEFVVQRRTPNGEFFDLATLPPKGENSFYSFRDESAFKTTEAFYIYRLKIVDNDNSITYSAEVSVAHQVSSVKRTWGSIKALFR
ncbi:MAG: hypothetical protein D6830_02110 [Ignavibacteria bacterium]|nr:MAG: hypothetical protein D6830_02110 [Ignavibacteria bacterium]